MTPGKQKDPTVKNKSHLLCLYPDSFFFPATSPAVREKPNGLGWLRRQTPSKLKLQLCFGLKWRIGAVLFSKVCFDAINAPNQPFPWCIRTQLLNTIAVAEFFSSCSFVWISRTGNGVPFLSSNALQIIQKKRSQVLFSVLTPSPPPEHEKSLSHHKVCTYLTNTLNQFVSSLRSPMP